MNRRIVPIACLVIIIAALVTQQSLKQELQSTVTTVKYLQDEAALPERTDEFLKACFEQDLANPSAPGAGAGQTSGRGNSCSNDRSVPRRLGQDCPQIFRQEVA